MSRIREALKQAAQERAEHPTDFVSSTIDPAPAPAITQEPGGVPSDLDNFGGSVQIHRPSRRSVVPFEELLTQCAHPAWNPDLDSNVFTRPLSTHAAEQFRTLRSRLYQMRNDQPLRTVLVTSSVSGEGKTFVSSNLAQAIVRKADQRAILVDADLRRPRLHKLLGAPAGPGLSDYLGGTADEMSIIQQSPEDENLCFIPAGSIVTNHSELLSNDKVKTLLERLTTIFDWVIVDSPPCLPVADASVLAALCDAVLVVLRAQSTPAAAIQKTCQQLEGRNVAGIILNGAHENQSYDSTYYYKYEDTPEEAR